jgi:diguanylate cyclase (GGDEF) domain
MLSAIGGALAAAALIVISALHVMSSTNDLAAANERVRAAEIAAILAQMPEAEARAALPGLARLAGLRNLAMTSMADLEPDRQSIPLLMGPLGGEFLSWTADRPGTHLFVTFAPLRVPAMLALMGAVLICVIAMQRRIKRIERERIHARQQAMRDHLTGMPNRLALETELARLAEARRPFSMLALDLDRFKPINDLFGHHAGDLALIEVAQRLAAQLEPGEFLARIGGDEFVAIVQRGGERSVLTQFARDCIAAVSQPLYAVGQNVTVDVSLGIVEEGLDHPASALLKRADRALYEAKRLAGGAFCFAGDGGGRVFPGPVETPQDPPAFAAAG